MRRSPIIILALLVFTSAFALACAGGSGGSASGGGAAESVPVKLTEFKVDTAKTTYKVGQAYKFDLTNAGTVAHEFMIMPRGEMSMDKALLTVKDTDLPAGKTLSKEFTFTKAGDYEIACHVAGHYEGGMHLNITVS